MVCNYHIIVLRASYSLSYFFLNKSDVREYRLRWSLAEISSHNSSCLYRIKWKYKFTNIYIYIRFLILLFRNKIIDCRNFRKFYILIIYWNNLTIVFFFFVFFTVCVIRVFVKDHIYRSIKLLFFFFFIIYFVFLWDITAIQLEKIWVT